MPSVLAIDVGGSKIVAAVVDAAGVVSGRVQRPLAVSQDQAGVMAAVKSLAHEAAGVGVDAIGVTIPGLADPEAGLWVYSPFSGIRDVPVKRLLEDEFRLPVGIENDVNACARAEMRFGLCADGQSFIWLTVSNGIGGCVVVDGRVMTGADNCAGEIGHVIVVEDGVLCGCGHHGCAEVYGAGPAIARRWREAGGAPGLDAKAIAELARRGDATARRVFGDTGYFIGKALAPAVSLLNPHKVVLGGGVSLSFDLFQEQLWAALGALAFPAALEHLTVEPTALGYDAGLLGAAAIVLPPTA